VSVIILFSSLLLPALLTSTPDNIPPMLRLFNPLSLFFLLIQPPPISTLFPYTTLFRSPCTTTVPSRPTSAVKTQPSASALGSSRSEEHTSELQSRSDLVCRLLLEKKKKLDVLSDFRQTVCMVSRCVALKF